MRSALEADSHPLIKDRGEAVVLRPCVADVVPETIGCSATSGSCFRGACCSPSGEHGLGDSSRVGSPTCDGDDVWARTCHGLGDSSLVGPRSVDDDVEMDASTNGLGHTVKSARTLVDDVGGHGHTVKSARHAGSSSYEGEVDAYRKETTCQAVYVYVDNLGVLGSPVGAVRDSIDRVTKVFDEAGLITHEREIATGPSLALGALLGPKKLRTSISPQRLWKVRGALVWALRCRALAGRTWEVIVGHLTFCLIGVRPCMAPLSAIHKFIRANYWEGAPLWPSARAEMQAVKGLLLLVVADWWLPWTDIVGASDASEDGYGLCVARWPMNEVRAAGRTVERSRFRKGPGRSARDDYFEAAGFEKDDYGEWVEKISENVAEDVSEGSDGEDHQQVWLRDSAFPEIPLELLAPRLWRVVAARRFFRKEDIMILESRALLRSLQLLITRYGLMNRRLVLLVDNMSVCLCFDRMRSRSFPVLVQIRKFAAWCLALNLKITVRWVPSEVNISDAPSRFSTGPPEHVFLSLANRLAQVSSGCSQDVEQQSGKMPKRSSPCLEHGTRQTKARTSSPTDADDEEGRHQEEVRADSRGELQGEGGDGYGERRDDGHRGRYRDARDHSPESSAAPRYRSEALAGGFRQVGGESKKFPRGVGGDQGDACVVQEGARGFHSMVRRTKKRKNSQGMAWWTTRWSPS